MLERLSLAFFDFLLEFFFFLEGEPESWAVAVVRNTHAVDASGALNERGEIRSTYSSLRLLLECYCEGALQCDYPSCLRVEGCKTKSQLSQTLRGLHRLDVDKVDVCVWSTVWLFGCLDPIGQKHFGIWQEIRIWNSELRTAAYARTHGHPQAAIAVPEWEPGTLI